METVHNLLKFRMWAKDCVKSAPDVTEAITSDRVWRDDSYHPSVKCEHETLNILNSAIKGNVLSLGMQAARLVPNMWTKFRFEISRIALSNLSIGFETHPRLDVGAHISNPAFCLLRSGKSRGDIVSHQPWTYQIFPPKGYHNVQRKWCLPLCIANLALISSFLVNDTTRQAFQFLAKQVSPSWMRGSDTMKCLDFVVHSAIAGLLSLLVWAYLNPQPPLESTIFPQIPIFTLENSFESLSKLATFMIFWHQTLKFHVFIGLSRDFDDGRGLRGTREPPIPSRLRMRPRVSSVATFAKRNKEIWCSLFCISVARVLDCVIWKDEQMSESGQINPRFRCSFHC
jgi:hypothetical protein